MSIATFLKKLSKIRVIWLVVFLGLVILVLSTTLLMSPKKVQLSISEAFSIWVIGDAHVHTEINNDYSSLQASITDSLRGGDEGGASFKWDIILNTGDFTGKQACPSDKQGATVVKQYEVTGFDPNRMYSVIGNHDSGESNADWFNKWIDPLGQNSNYSRISNHLRPFQVSGQWDHYSFQAGNVLFLMLGDNNFGGPPFGRECKGGYPAGRYSKETYDWWVKQIEDNPDKIIVTVAHHALHETTIYTGFDEAAKLGVHGGITWADERGSSFIYAIDNWTVDGFNEKHEFIGEPPFGFRKYLKEHPGAIDFWIHGHSHFHLFPGKELKGRSDVEFVDGVWFVNSGALAKFHGAPDVPFSRLILFEPNSSIVTMKTYLHAAGWNGNPEGFYAPAEKNFILDKTFQPQ